MTLLLHGLWWRRGLTAALLGVAVVTTTAAALGPIYARTSAESILHDHLTQAGWTAGLWLRENIDVGNSAAYQRLIAKLPAPGAVRGYDTRVAGLYTPNGLGVSAGADVSGVGTHLVWKAGQCQHLVIVRGRCPTGPGEAMLSARTVATGIFGSGLGSQIYLGSIIDPDDPNSWYHPLPPPPPPARVVGIYRPKSSTDPFWFGQTYFDAQTTAKVDYIDSVFVAEGEFLSQPKNTFVEADFDYPLTASALRLDDVPAERIALAQLLRNYARGDQIAAESGLLKVFDAAAHERHLVDIGTLLVTLQLCLLAWLVLFQVAADAIGARGDEIAMAKLRGRSFLATVRFVLAEPITLLAVAVPIGVGLAVAATHVFADSTFAPGVPVKLTWTPVLTALIAFAGGLSAAALGGYQTLTRSVLDQWQRTTRRPGHGRLALTIDVLLAAAAIAGLVVLRADRQAGHENDTAALLAPGLLVFAVAIIGVRLVPLSCRWLARLTRASRSLGLFLAARQVARRPVGLRLAALLAVAAGLATFAVSGESVATVNRTHRAEAELGATRVASVQFDPGLDPVAAAHRADPGGTWAMTAATWLPDGGDSVAGAVLGVDTSRLGAVGYSVAGEPSAASLAAALAPPVPPISVRTSRMRVHLTATALSGNVRPHVQLNFRTPTNPALNADGGALSDGTSDYPIDVSCTAGCKLRGITWDRPILAVGTLAGTITLTGLDTWTGQAWRPLDIGTRVAKSWHAATPLGQATDAVAVGPTGIVDHFASIDGGYGGIGYSSDPSPMPAIATPGGLVSPENAASRPQMQDDSNNVAYFQVVRTVSVLPAVLDNGVMLDVGSLQDELPTFVAEADWQVWLGAKAPSDALARLAAAGLQVQDVRSVAERDDELARQAPALALLLLLVCAIAGAALAAGGTAISITANGRRRSYELAALRAIGVRREPLVRASIAEQLLLLGGAVVLGVPTGLIAARVAMPAIPEFADPTPIALHYTPQLLPTAIFTVTFVVLLVVTAFVGARALIRAAVPSRLRAAE